MQPMEFRKIIYAHYKKHGRRLPWRLNPRSLASRSSASRIYKTSRSQASVFYRTLVSEIMLQQTQVDRVIPKYEEFLKKFPTLRALARAELVEVLRAWQGLGYNRRAVWLHEAARELIKNPSPLWGTPFTPTPILVRGFRKGRIQTELQKFKGIGLNTAASICAFAYNMPVVFIETNIRTVFLKHFFPYEKNVSDKDILQLVKKTLPKKHFREWYWALMDYGSYVKRTQGNLNRTQSVNYAKQSKFKGSHRQLRGKILRDLLHGKNISRKNTQHISVLGELEREGFII